ncbi:MAG: YraN family protein [Baekduia sp.]
MEAQADSRRALGDRGETLAAEHLERLGFEIVARQHRTRFGEIDLVAFDGRTLAFCEVKTRRPPGSPFDALGPRKQLQVRRMAAAYLADEGTSRPRAHEIRFDAIGVVIGPSGELLRLDHLAGAF